MAKSNCWEFMKCGREPGGPEVKDKGICVASLEKSCDGLNRGKNAGRICWSVAGTFCGRKVQGKFAQKSVSCMSCDFFKSVQREEDASAFTLLKAGQKYESVR